MQTAQTLKAIRDETGSFRFDRGLTYEAEAEGVTRDDFLRELLEIMPLP